MALTGGTLTSGGTLKVASLVQSGANSVLTGAGTVTISGTGSQWSGGLMTGGGTTGIAAGADLTVAGGSRKFLGNRTIANQGTLIEASTANVVDFDGTAVVNNAAAFDIRSNQTWENFTGPSGTLTINNSGTLKKTAGTGAFTFSDTELTNGGTISVTSGTLNIGGQIFTA